MKQLKKILIFFLLLLSIFLGLWLAQDNQQPVVVTLLGFPLESLPLGLWLVAMFAAGVVLGLLAGVPTILNISRKNRKLQKQVSSDG